MASDDILHIESISQIHKAMGYTAPAHPLITMLSVEEMHAAEHIKPRGQRVSSSLYSVFLKDGNCGMQYGRNTYDFEEGVMGFTAPNQVFTNTGDQAYTTGWIMFFHPDLIRNTHLGESIHKYNFFSYDVHEALHLSDREQGIINDLVDKIRMEYEQNIDGHTQGLLVSQLELLLNYCLRFYERQFHTRKTHNVDTLAKVDKLLRNYYATKQQEAFGMPTIQYLADRVSLSPNYLSDLLKKETGRNAKEHINLFVVEKAKSLLVSTGQTVSEIAYDLGFNYPHYFSRMFKQHTGMSPKMYRNFDLN